MVAARYNRAPPIVCPKRIATSPDDIPREASTLPESISATEIAAPAQIRNNERLENPLVGESFDIEVPPLHQESTIKSAEMVK